MKIKIIYDSTISMSPEQAAQYDAVFTPFIINDGGNSYKDGVDMSAKEFYEHLKRNDHITTSQPNISDTIELFKKTLEEYDHIIYITIPAALSGTYAAGVLAAKEVDESRISVVDVHTGAGTSDFMVKKGYELVNEGKSVEEIIDYFMKLSKNSDLYIIPYNMETLKRSGRVSNLAASVFSLIKLKIGLKMNDEGAFEKFEVARTDSKIINKMISDVKAKLGDKDLIIYLIYTDEEDMLDMPKKTLEKEFSNVEYRKARLCPTIGAHSGLKTIGFQFIKKY